MSYRKIGIIGGVGPSATILYYRGIIAGYQKRKGDLHFPAIVIHSLDYGQVIEYFEKNTLEVLSEKLVQVIDGLRGSGCSFAVLACNGMHMVFDRVQERSSLPMLNLIECVLKEVKSRRVKRVGLIGTTFAMRSGLYRQPLERSGIECLVPDEPEQDWIMKVINVDLQQTCVPHDTVVRLLKDVDALGERGAEGIILGCTDLPAAITSENSPIPLFDSTKLHVEAILDWSLGITEAIH